MKNRMKKVLAIAVSSVLCMGVLSGCTVTIDPGKGADDKININVAEADEEEPEKISRSAVKGEEDLSFAVGTWYTEDYDEDENWAGSYKLELKDDGTASCEGWRNKDAGYFEVTDSDTVLITFDDCQIDTVGKGYEAVEDFIYTVEMTIDGDDADIKIDAPDVISNLEDGKVHRKSDKAGVSRMYSDEEGDGEVGADFAVGTWYTEDYDENENWAISYKIELTEDGEATCVGWRNKDAGTYEVTGDNTVLITFDDCQTSSFRNDYKPVKGFEYTIEMTIDGDDAKIKIDAPDVISNLEDGTVHRNAAKAGVSRMYSDEEEGDEGEGADIADGEYLTDETYTGELSKDGKTMTITTALNHEDKDWNLVQDYEKRTYVFTVSDKCKCVVIGEDKEVDSFFDRLDFIEEFLEGNSGLPITLTIKNNELTEILFTS